MAKSTTEKKSSPAKKTATNKATPAKSKTKLAKDSAAKEIKVSRSRRRAYQTVAETPVAAQPEVPVSPPSAPSEPSKTNNAHVQPVPPKEKPAQETTNKPRTRASVLKIPTERSAQRIVDNSMAWSMGMGVIPVPLVDAVGIMTIQLVMLQKLSFLYDKPFSTGRAKSIIAALIGGLGSVSLATGLAGGLVKLVPVVGTAAGVVSMPAFAGATTYAIGKLFIRHYEMGGTLLTLDPEELKEYFHEQLREGKTIATRRKK